MIKLVKYVVYVLKYLDTPITLYNVFSGRGKEEEARLRSNNGRKYSENRRSSEKTGAFMVY